MKAVKRVLIILGSALSLCLLGLVFYLGLTPDKHAVLLERIEAIALGQGEKLEVSPVRSLQITYDFPLSWEDVGAGIDLDYGDTVYTYFQDIGGDLWLPYRLERDPIPVAKAFLCDAHGILRWLEADACVGDSSLGELRISASALAGLPEEDYWLGVLCDAERESWYRLYYLSVHPQCTFHTEAYGLATGGCSDSVRFDRSATDEGFDFHLYNLGDNRVTDVWKLEETISVSAEGRRNFHRKKLPADAFTLSANGATVTLSQAYLDSLATLYPYYFLFGLGDHTTISSADIGEYGVALALADGPITTTYVDASTAYSLSSGGDYMFTVHMGDASGIWTEDNTTGLLFFDDEGQADEAFFYGISPADIGEDGNCVIPATVLREAAERGNTNFWLNVTFRLSDFYNEGFGCFVRIID